MWVFSFIFLPLPSEIASIQTTFPLASALPFPSHDAIFSSSFPPVLAPPSYPRPLLRRRRCPIESEFRRKQLSLAFPHLGRRDRHSGFRFPIVASTEPISGQTDMTSSANFSHKEKKRKKPTKNCPHYILLLRCCAKAVMTTLKAW